MTCAPFFVSLRKTQAMERIPLTKAEKAMFVAAASRWEGYLEKETRDVSQYDSKTANPGMNNYNRFSRRFDNVVFGGKPAKDGYPWCATFVFSSLYDALFAAKHGGKYPSLEEKPDPQTVQRLEQALGADDFKYLAGVVQWTRILPRTATPEPGDLIVFLSKHARPIHIGIVVDYAKGKVCTIEGNTSAAGTEVDPNGGCCAKKIRKDENVLFLKL